MRSRFSLCQKALRFNRLSGGLPIRVRLFLITFSMSLLFLAIIFITNTLLLQPYYNYMKEKKLTSTLHEISGLDLSDRDESGHASGELANKAIFTS